MSEPFVVHPAPLSNSSEDMHFGFLASPVPILNVDFLFKQRLLRGLMIGRNRSICGGDPLILGTRISVPIVIERIQNLGYNLNEITTDLRNTNYNPLKTAIEEIISVYPQLNQQQILACIEYYENHKKDIERIIEEERSVDA